MSDMGNTQKYKAANFKNLIGKKLFRDIHRSNPKFGISECYLV